MDTMDEIKKGLDASLMTWDELNAIPRDVLDGVENFWEPGYDYDDPDFWTSYPDVFADFIRAVRSYDKLQTEA